MQARNVCFLCLQRFGVTIEDGTAGEWGFQGRVE